LGGSGETRWEGGGGIKKIERNQELKKKHWKNHYIVTSLGDGKRKEEIAEKP